MAQNLFEEVLNDGTLESNGPHNAPSINLFYRSNPVGVVMKAELRLCRHKIYDILRKIVIGKK